jgi:uncharacterized protein (DUF1800 family)
MAASQWETAQMHTHGTPSVNRRQVHLLGLGLAAGFALKPTLALAQASAPAAQLLHDQWRVLSRLGYGPSPDSVAALEGQDVRGWAIAQLDAAHAASQQAPRLPPELAAINASLPQIFDGARRERQAREQRKETAAEGTPRAPDMGAADMAENPLRFSANMAEGATTWRLMSCSAPELEHPLLARMTEFWFNHFNVYVGKGAVRPFVGHYLINVARAHALGRFEDLVLASARHPAMLHYLDQQSSVAEGTRAGNGSQRGLNENYARELLELHTLGVNGGYTQGDVRALARILTGWTIDPQAESGFRFNLRNHDTGSKTLLGQSYGGVTFASGEREGVAAIKALVRHPSTARRVCLRLAQFFVADEPSAALVQALSQTFTQSDGDMRQVMLTLLQSQAFWDPQQLLFKTPMDYACSVLAATEGWKDPQALVAAARFLNQAGQPVHGWQTPDGYSFSAATWRVPEALTRRADFAMQLARQKDTRFLWPFLRPQTVGIIEHEARNLHSGLTLASPEFQWK